MPRPICKIPYTVWRSGKMSIECKYLRMRDGSPRPNPSYYLIEYVDGRKKRTYLKRELVAGLLPLLEASSAVAGGRVGRPGDPGEFEEDAYCRRIQRHQGDSQQAKAESQHLLSICCRVGVWKK